jgi:microcystin synthetase protein McyB
VEELREHCRSHLPSFMIPSMFIVVEQFPLNENGKLDRKRLPTPDFSMLSFTVNDQQYMMPRDELEMRIHSLWCEILQGSRISTNASFFSVGGHSLLLIQLYQGYKMTFGLDTNVSGISEIFQHPTISEHAVLIRQLANNQLRCEMSPVSMHVFEGRSDR